MIRRMALSVGLLGVCTWALALVAWTESPAQVILQRSFEPVASHSALRLEQQHHLEALGSLLRKPARWREPRQVVHHAELLGELANVLSHGLEKPAARQAAETVRTLALQLADAAKNRASADDAKLMLLYQRLLHAFAVGPFRPERGAAP